MTDARLSDKELAQLNAVRPFSRPGSLTHPFPRLLQQESMEFVLVWVSHLRVLSRST